MPEKRPPLPIPITAEFEGKTYSADYFLESGLVTVRWAFGSKAAQVGVSRAEIMALRLFRELLGEAKWRGII